ncbi:MAG: MotA/TolQ/ExbB proton channel family protein [bacterium]|nr:MotA/TolQ/ExbB proton channel family protein [bacterium]
MRSKRQVKHESFTQSLLPVLLLGSLASGVFLGLILAGPLDYGLLRRYCLNHPVAIACVCLFFVGIITLVLKWYQAVVQAGATRKATLALHQLTIEGAEIPSHQRAEWLDAHWQRLHRAVAESWMGRRLTSVLDLQIRRGRRLQLEADLQLLSDAEADRQHDSYSLLRIINWAMPMLGFLGTVLGISQTLGQLDTQMLASQQQDAMNQLTAGLYVAFDTTAIALILTVFLMFLQFGVSRIEQSLLSTISMECNPELIAFLGADPHDSQSSLLAPVREMAADLVAAVRELTESQAEIWSRSINESQEQWSDWTIQAAETIENGFGESLRESLEKHVSGMQSIQKDAHSHLDARWQQWQTTLSEQARTIQGQQKELVRQTDALQGLADAVQQLIGQTSDLQKLEETISQSVDRLSKLNHFEEASHCMSEAVAVLATSLERAGLIRGAPVRPRVSGVRGKKHEHSTDWAADTGPDNVESEKLSAKDSMKGKAA